MKTKQMNIIGIIVLITGCIMFMPGYAEGKAISELSVGLILLIVGIALLVVPKFMKKK